MKLKSKSGFSFSRPGQHSCSSTIYIGICFLYEATLVHIRLEFYNISASKNPIFRDFLKYISNRKNMGHRITHPFSSNSIQTYPDSICIAVLGQQCCLTSIKSRRHLQPQRHFFVAETINVSYFNNPPYKVAPRIKGTDDELRLRLTARNRGKEN